MNEYRILTEAGEGRIEEKKSRFIATLRSVESEEEANAFIAEMKKKYWDARHNCSAFVIGSGAELTRCSDDGEPAGTAGRPMLEVLLGSGVRNVAVVVTRYFGGTLLGTGGLIRAYTAAVQEGLAASRIGVRYSGKRLKLITDYTDIGKVLYILGNHGLEPESSDYGADVRLEIPVSDEVLPFLRAELTEGTAGRIRMEEGDPEWFLREERDN